MVVAMRSSGYRNHPMSRFGFTAVSLICFSLVAYGLLNSRSTGAPARVLRSPLLISLGKYSLRHVRVASAGGVLLAAFFFGRA
jgi:hypothetical protein